MTSNVKLQLVNNIHELKDMAKRGFIELHSHTGKTVSSPFGDVKAWYIEDGQSSFVYNDKRYKTEYRSGSFFPYVYKVN